MSVLQALQTIKDTLDGTLSFRWSCRMAVCGSCGMMINGKPRLACNTFLRDLPPGPVTIEPLNNFPIERDLVVTVGDFVKKIESIYPYIIPKEPKTDRGWTLSPDPGSACRLRVLQRLHQLHAVLRSLPTVRRESGLHRPRRHGAPSALQRRFSRRRPAKAARLRSMARTACGPARPSASAPRSVPSMSTPPTPSIRTRRTARSTSSCAF